jgi:hypothetical protein
VRCSSFAPDYGPSVAEQDDVDALGAGGRSQRAVGRDDALPRVRCGKAEAVREGEPSVAPEVAGAAGADSRARSGKWLVPSPSSGIEQGYERPCAEPSAL